MHLSKCKNISKDDNVVLYKPRSDLKGSVICHFGEIHSQKISLEDRITIRPID